MTKRHPLDVRRDETPARPDPDLGSSVDERIARRITEERRQHADNRAAWYKMRAAAAFDRAWDRAWRQHVLRRELKGYRNLREELIGELLDRYPINVVVNRAEALQRAEKRSRP